MKDSPKPLLAEVGTAPKIAVVGSPNAGKSTLVNRLSGTRATVVHETPGVTRDRKVVLAEWVGRQFALVDTGGYDLGDTSDLAQAIRAQIRSALAEAVAVLMVVDAQAGPLPDDYEIAQAVRRTHLPVVLAANKIDDPRQGDLAAQFYELGLGEALPISAMHGIGIGELLDRILTVLPTEAETRAETPASVIEIPTVIVGRPNAGKSSLLNAIAGEQRVIVSDVPGTTRDAVDTSVVTTQGRFRFIDTAGMRKAAKVSGVEYYSYLRSLESLDRAHVAVVVADATVGIGELDITVCAEAARRGCATVVALNKWDLAQPDVDEIIGVLHRKVRQQPSVVPVSAVTGEGLARLLSMVADLEARYTAHIPTAELNRALAAANEMRSLPSKGGRRLKTYFIAQFQTAPPRFAVRVNDRSLVTRDYGFFVENQLRQRLNLPGVPVIIDFREA